MTLHVRRRRRRVALLHLATFGACGGAPAAHATQASALLPSWMSGSESDTSEFYSNVRNDKVEDRDRELKHSAARRLVPDYGWAEVMRFGPQCDASVEGWSAGFPTDCGDDYASMGRPELASCNATRRPPANVSYGCWFFFSEKGSAFGGDFKVRAGSGVTVNVGRSLRVDTRAEASAALGLPCADPPLCEKPGTVQDKLYCERAVQRGYDSIQMARPHMACVKEGCLRGYHSLVPAELVLCTKGCMSQPLTDACPPGVELRRATGAGHRHGRPCHCREGSHYLNCGKDELLYGRIDNGTQRCPYNLTSPELYEFDQFIIHPSLLPALHHIQKLRIWALLKASGERRAQRWVAAAAAAVQSQDYAQKLTRQAKTAQARARAASLQATANRAAAIATGDIALILQAALEGDAAGESTLAANVAMAMAENMTQIARDFKDAAAVKAADESMAAAAEAGGWKL